MLYCHAIELDNQKLPVSFFLAYSVAALLKLHFSYSLSLKEEEEKGTIINWMHGVKLSTEVIKFSLLNSLASQVCLSTVYFIDEETEAQKS